MRFSLVLIPVFYCIESPQPIRAQKPGAPLPAAAIARLTTGLDSSGTATHIHPVSFAPDGRTLAWADRKDHTVRIWDAATGEERNILRGHLTHVLCVDFAPDGKTLAAGSYDASIRIWEVRTGETKAILKNGDSGGMVYSLAFSPDGKILASGDWNGTIRFWNVATGKLLHPAEQRPGFIQVVAFSPDGKTVASGDSDGIVRMWDVATGKERLESRRDLRQIEGQRPGGIISSVTFSPDGTTLAAARGGGSGIAVWDVPTGRKMHVLDSPIGSLTVSFSADSKLLVSADREIRMWEMATAQVVLDIPEPRDFLYSIYSASFSPDGKLLATGGSDNAVILWDAFGLDRNQRPVSLTSQEVEKRWSELASDDAKLAYRALGTLAYAPQQTIPLLRERLRSIPAVDPRRVARLIADLDDDDFDIREKSTEELARFGEQVESALKKTLDGNPPVEVRYRATGLLKRLLPDALRSARSVMLLERIGSRDARQILEGLTKGEPRAAQTIDARAALLRLARRNGQ